MIGNLIWYCKICYISRFSQEKIWVWFVQTHEFSLSAWHTFYSYFSEQILSCEEHSVMNPFIPAEGSGLILLTLLGTVIFNDNRSHGSHVHKYVSKFKLATLWVLKNTHKLLPSPELRQHYGQSHVPTVPHDPRRAYLFHFCMHGPLPPWFRALNVEFHTDAL